MSNKTSRKSKIIAIPIDRSEGLAVAQWGDEEVKTEAEEMTELINEVTTEEEPVAEPLAIEDTPKPKAKRAPKAKAKAAPTVQEPEVEEVVHEAHHEAKTEHKVVEKVECPDCGKQMSTKTLRYSHAPNCTAKKNRQQQQTASPNIADELIEHEVQKRLNNFREDRVARKQKAIESLIASAF